ncbi:GNAT family N-acetyltransferase [Gluconobacter frateurii]|uniref:GCN5-like N-acetyltransferase n=1 Tax=Gluconobacter frateurii NRIC 0228 TaxID=1307946 RepID=A0ABQ0QAU5_9PROT|nr:GNAT family N-acetyltransferase [Gluconobacter frateurii]GBR11340.1 GCN5-like N-acetyltransferase [Gluconobacter frateurii NRIC 0228]GLP89070.1 hypothetical protein GCM10007868_01450 [Gluconobacter frateurii]
MTILYDRAVPSAEEFAHLLRKSGLGVRRPVDDLARLQRMLDGANLTVTARDSQSGELVGIARSITDGAYACYLSDLAVHEDYKGHGIGKKLIATTQDHAGPECACILIAAPDAVSFYQHIGMPQTDRAFVLPRTV